jgi:NADPH-ferrihemoprotein reductase
MEDYESENLAEENMLIIVCATYGEGEPPDNAKDFYEWVMEEEREIEDMLDAVNYTVFGLGNRTYEHYNVMGRRLDRRLKQLGANQVYARGEGDDDSTLEEDFAVWKKDLWNALFPVFGMATKAIKVVERRHLRLIEHNTPPAAMVEHWRLNTSGSGAMPSAAVASSTSPTSSTSTSTSSTSSGDVGTELKGITGIYDHRRPYLSKITVMRELHRGGDRSCLHIEMELPPKCATLTYRPGDHVAIFPENDPLLVERVIARLNTDPHMVRRCVGVFRTRACVCSSFCTVECSSCAGGDRHAQVSFLVCFVCLLGCVSLWVSGSCLTDHGACSC